MTKLLLIPALLIFINLSATPKPPDGISLEKHYKVESTFSGNTASEKTFHLIIAKNKTANNFEIIPAVYENKQLIKLAPIFFAKKPSIMSFHNDDNTLTLIVSKKEKRDNVFQVLDIDLASGNTNISKALPLEDFKCIIRKKDENLLVFATKEELKVVRILNSAENKTIIATPKSSGEAVLKEIASGILEAINKDEFVTNGSIKKYRIYSENNSVIISKEDVKSKSTAVATIPLTGEGETSFGTTVYRVKQKEAIKKSTSYFDKGSLFQLYINKKNGYLNIYNTSSKSVSEYDLSEAEISNTSSEFESLESFLKQAARAAHEPTITVNRTKSGNAVLRIDYVLKIDYSYRYNWWFHHQMMWQHQQMMHMQHVQNNIPRFTPSPDYYEVLAYYKPKKNHYFEIVLDQDNEIIEGDTHETVHRFIDKKHYIDRLDDMTNLKNESSVFTEEAFIYFGYNKNTSTFEVSEKLLDD